MDFQGEYRTIYKKKKKNTNIFGTLPEKGLEAVCG